MQRQGSSLERKFAQILVKDSLKITNKDIVSIGVAPHTIRLGEAIADECFKVGADALLNLWTDSYQESFLTNLSAESLREPSRFCVKLTEASTVSIWAYAAWDPTMYRKIPPEKFAAHGDGEYKAHWPLSKQRKLRSLFLGIALATKPRAKAYGFKFTFWKRNLYEAALSDPSRLSANGEKLARLLEEGRKVTIRAANETRLSFRLAGRMAFVYDGVIDADDIASENFDASLPAGEVAVAPDEESAEGRVVFDRPIRSQGRNFEGVGFTFKAGRLQKLEGSEYVEILKKQYEASSGDKDRIGSLSIGINPTAKFGFLHDGIVRGGIGVSVGFNEGVGGRNNTSFSLGGTIGSATLELDGKPIVVNGRLKPL